MGVNLDARRRLSLVLWLIALHSATVGLCLIFLPDSIVQQFGFNGCSERFFRAQGGVFHIVMTVAYSLPALNVERFRCMIIFSIMVKFMAVVFLLTYYFLLGESWTILLSGLGDGVMGLLILVAFLSYRRSE